MSRPAEIGARLRLDDLRRFATALGEAAGLAPARASALANHLLWYDAAGFPAHGIAALPGWLDRIAAGTVDPRAEGKVLTPEHAATAILDGQSGVAPLLLARAAGIAVEKAREVGVGMVRVCHLSTSGPAAAVAAEVAVGPYHAIVVGAGGEVAMACPSPEGLPLVYDSGLIPASTLGGGQPSTALVAWAGVVLPEEGWLVAAVTVPALEPLASFHERQASASGKIQGEGWLRPVDWELRRRAAREQGVALESGVIESLRQHGGRLGVAAGL